MAEAEPHTAPEDLRLRLTDLDPSDLESVARRLGLLDELGDGDQPRVTSSAPVPEPASAAEPTLTLADLADHEVDALIGSLLAEPGAAAPATGSEPSPNGSSPGKAAALPSAIAGLGDAGVDAMLEILMAESEAAPLPESSTASSEMPSEVADALDRLAAAGQGRVPASGDAWSAFAATFHRAVLAGGAHLTPDDAASLGRLLVAASVLGGADVRAAIVGPAIRGDRPDSNPPNLRTRGR